MTGAHKWLAFFNEIGSWIFEEALEAASLKKKSFYENLCLEFGQKVKVVEWISSCQKD